jgi:hypothetical protein
MKIWIWNAIDLRNADGKYSMSDPYVKVILKAPYSLDRGNNYYYFIFYI